MILSVLALHLLAAQPNIFDPSEMSSEVIAVTVDACLGGILKADPQASKTDAMIFCSCTVDAIRLNTKKGLRPPKNAATQDQMQRCHEALEGRKADKAREQKRGKSGT